MPAHGLGRRDRDAVSAGKSAGQGSPWIPWKEEGTLSVVQC